MPSNSTKREPIDRFVALIEFPEGDGCWVWGGSKKKGTWAYGYFAPHRKPSKAHRWAYEWFVGPIPEGKVIDHLCRNPSCVNPFHLEPVSVRTNTLRGRGPSAVHAVKTHCLRGHEFTPENTYYKLHDGARMCRECMRLSDAKRRRRT